MGIIIVFIKNLPEYAFISVSHVLYVSILADYKSGSRGEVNNSSYMSLNIN